MKKPTAYSGDKPYIFVSYAHSDSNVVYPFIEELSKKYNVWFDDGIELGKDYEKFIIEHINKCSLFLFLVSNKSLYSDYCELEIKYATGENKKFINVPIESCQFPDWFRFRFLEYQMFNLYEYNDLSLAVEKLTTKSSSWFDACLKEKEEEKVDVSIEKEEETLSDLENFIIIKGVLKSYLGHDEIVRVPDSVHEIDGYVFMSNKTIIKLIISKNVKNISVHAFSWMQRLECIEVEAENKYFSSLFGVLYNKKQTALLHYPKNKANEEFIVTKNVKLIDTHAFFAVTFLKELKIESVYVVLNSSSISACKIEMIYFTAGGEIDFKDSAIIDLSNLKAIYYHGNAMGWFSNTKKIPWFTLGKMTIFDRKMSVPVIFQDGSSITEKTKWDKTEYNDHFYEV